MSGATFPAAELMARACGARFAAQRRLGMSERLGLAEIGGSAVILFGIRIAHVGSRSDATAAARAGAGAAPA